MVGVGTLLFLLAAWYALSWLLRRDYPRLRVFLWIASAAGVLAVLALESGWVVTEVGRQPWIVHNYMTVSQAATTNGGVWITFVTIVAIYAALGTTVVLVLRRMARSWDRGIDETAVPYGPSPVTLAEPPAEEVPVP
jgi:cytochrome d ubiquinol oxidase subunit I